MEDQYTLDRFFRVQSEFALPDGSKIYLRSLSDDEMGTREKAAVRAARNKRLELRDESSAAFVELVQTIQYGTDEDLLDTIVSSKQHEFRSEALELYPRRHIPYPDDADLEERMDIDDKREQHERDVLKEQKEHVQQKSEEYRAKAKEWPHEKLVSRCQALQVGVESMGAYLQEYNVQLLLLGSFSDKKRKKPYFASATDVRELDPRINQPLLAKLKRLNEVDIFTIQGFSSTAS